MDTIERRSGIDRRHDPGTYPGEERRSGTNRRLDDVNREQVDAAATQPGPSAWSPPQGRRPGSGPEDDVIPEDYE